MSKREEMDYLHGKSLDIALGYIETEIRHLERRKLELEHISERLIARNDLFEKSDF